MFFKLLRLFGLDVPARIAEVRIDLEERVELAKDQINQTAQTAAVLAALFVLGGLAAFAWSTISWEVLGWHEKGMINFQNEDEVSAIIASLVSRGRSTR